MIGHAAEIPVRTSPEALYIEPISACNLHCKMCYANVINGPGQRVIEADGVLDFARRFVASTSRQVTIYWCGTGEVFLHRDFPRMVNRLLAEYGEDRLAQSIQTNGMVRRLEEFASLRRLRLRVSIDGLRQFHERNRGNNTYDRAIGFCREAVELGCPSLCVRMLLTRDSIAHLDEFHAELLERIGPQVELELNVPYSNADLRWMRTKAMSILQDDVDDIAMITRAEALQVLERRYHNRYRIVAESEIVENYICLTTYGVFTCCEGIVSLGEPETNMLVLRERLAASEPQCRSCALFPC
jgi:MoaA/NifB/PqqE/SkfB family radical SAM enzyme